MNGEQIVCSMWNIFTIFALSKINNSLITNKSYTQKTEI